MITTPESRRTSLGWVSALSSWGADHFAGVEVTPPPAFFTTETLADRHERLVKAAASAPRGQRVRLQQMARAACLERLRAELRGNT